MPTYDKERLIIKYQLAALRLSGKLPLEDIAALLKNTYALLNSVDEEDYNLSLSVICHVAEVPEKDARVSELLRECIVKSRVFLYQDMLDGQENTTAPALCSIADLFARNFYTSRSTDTTFTKEQKEILDFFAEHPRIVVSAPTSFGKTKIIEEILLSNEYRNAILIFPTVALLSEQYTKLKNSQVGKIYQISKSSRVKINTKQRNLLILTPERLTIFLDDNPDFSVDFFAMDEIYKSDRKSKDDRFRVFTYCLYRLAKMTDNFYLIGPYFDDFSKGFCDRFDAKFMRFGTEIVQKDHFTRSEINTGKLTTGDIRVVKDSNKTLLRTIAVMRDPRSLIYRKDKRLAESTAIKLAESTGSDADKNSDLCKYIAETVSPKWALITCLEKGVAFHHGGIPRHIQESIVEAFNKGNVNQIVCTTSLTEGVNTTAKNVFIMDNAIGTRKKLKVFERKNIEGRSGRLTVHFVGNVIYLDTMSDDEDDDYKIDLEYWDNKDLSPESMIQIDAQDLSPELISERRRLLDDLKDKNIPHELIRSNRYIAIDGQIRLIEHLRNAMDLQACQFSGTKPSNEALTKILELAYDYLFSDNNKRSRSFTRGRAVALTKYYAAHQPKIPLLINNQMISPSKDINTRIRSAFTFTSHFLEFAWPRYLKAFNALFNFVASEKGVEGINLELTIMILEYGTEKPYEVILKDAGIPNDVISKVGGVFKECETFEDVLACRQENDAELKRQLSGFEYRLLVSHL